MVRNIDNRIALAILVIICVAVVAIIITINSNKEKLITDKDYLYAKVEQYLIEREKPSKDDADNFKVFTDIAKLGITKKGDENYVYVWALVQSFYVENGKLATNNAYSKPYKFTIKHDKIINSETPKEGKEYTASVKKLFPDYIRKQFNVNLVNGEEVGEEVQSYYQNMQKRPYDQVVDVMNTIIM